MNTVKREHLICDLENVASRVGTGTVTIKQYEKLGRFGRGAYYREFGSWNNALNGLGLFTDRCHAKHKHPERNIKPGIKVSVLNRDNRQCVYCGASSRDTQLVIDHIIPIHSGGKSVVENLQTLCRTCNLGKGVRQFTTNTSLKPGTVGLLLSLRQFTKQHCIHCTARLTPPVNATHCPPPLIRGVINLSR